MRKFSPRTLEKAAVALLLVFAASSVSFAQQYCGCQSSRQQPVRTAYHANVDWPRIYIPAARQTVCATYDAMVNNGWRRQNLLGDYHFKEDSNELTNAGKLKVNWILSQAPLQRRNVFVQRGGEELQTTARVAAVHDYAGNMSPSVGQIDVSDTHIVAEGHPAESVDATFRAFQAIHSQLPTTSPYLEASSGGGSSSGQ